MAFPFCPVQIQVSVACDLTTAEKYPQKREVRLDFVVIPVTCGDRRQNQECGRGSMRMRACSLPVAMGLFAIFRRRCEVESIVGRARSKIVSLVSEVDFMLSKVVGVAQLVLRPLLERQ